jgi:V8-like Glu-specific endopeptidase
MTGRQDPSTRRIGLSLVLSLAALACFGVSSAAASATKVASLAGSHGQLKQVKRYWTVKRMKSAIPLRATPTRHEVARGARSSSSAAGRGKPVTIQPTTGSNAGSAKQPMAQQVPNPTVYPYRTQGKLFFVSGGSGYVCSATVVNTPSQRVIFSAGHCAIDAGFVSHNVAFVPGYHNGARPYGTFVATKWASTPGWINNENFSDDMSAFVLGGTRKVAAVVGARGIKVNQPRQENFVSYGYPAGSPFNGETLWNCPSPYRGQDPDTGNPRTQWITCNMTGGSSGGGWIIQNQYLNSVNSYGYNGEPNRMYGPYFGNQAMTLYNTVKNQAP